MVAEQLRGETAESPTIILEPAGRNTAPAIALAALQAQAQHPEALLLVLPADHHVTDPAAFRATVERAAAPAKAGQLDDLWCRAQSPRDRVWLRALRRGTG